MSFGSQPPPPPPPPDQTPAWSQPAAPAPGGPARQTKGLIIGVGVVIVAAVAAVVGWLVTRDGGDGSGVGSSAPEASEAVSSDARGTVTSPGGATLEIPVGAVPMTQNGEVGEIVFTIDEQQTADRQANLPQGLQLAPTAFSIGPDLQNLDGTVMLTLPIPADVPIEQVGGLARYDEAEGQWIGVPARVDAASRTVSAVYFSGETTATWTIRTIVRGQIEVFTGTISPSSGEQQTRISITQFRVG